MNVFPLIFLNETFDNIIERYGQLTDVPLDVFCMTDVVWLKVSGHGWFQIGQLRELLDCLAATPFGFDVFPDLIDRAGIHVSTLLRSFEKDLFW